MTKRTPLTAQDIRDCLTTHDRKCLEAVRRDGEARKALRVLAQKANVPEEGMLLLFVEAAHAIRDQQSNANTQVTTVKDVGKLVTRLYEISDEIRKLNEETFWNAKRPAWDYEGRIPTDPNDFVDFTKLPRFLEGYARSLTIKAATVLRRRKLYRQPNRKKIMRRKEKSPFLGIHGMPDSGGIGSIQYRIEMQLFGTIKRWTGRKNREKVAAILSIVYPMFHLYLQVGAASFRKRDQRARGTA